ncbi:MAG: putative zinc-binding metallopeptidase, partial [Gammaproteobacteria bacterium]
EDTYRYRPYSKSFVRHLDYHYAQYHPDEDWCETFAVWLTPGLDWRARYAGWKALAKLEFVDKLMKSIAGKVPRKGGGRQYWRAAKIRRTLRRYYEQRRKAEAESQPDFHDANLKRMFAAGDARYVAKLLERYRKPIVDEITGWTGERKYMVNEVFKKVYQRSKALGLATDDSESQAVLKLSTYLTTLLMNYRHTNRLRGVGLRGGI